MFDPDIKELINTKPREIIKKPSMYKVLLVNDDYTTMEFVVEILMMVFKRSAETATKIMLDVHRNGAGICGVYTYEVAETKVDTVHNLAEQNGFPLKCKIEKE